jgi:hypothetical protein
MFRFKKNYFVAMGLVLLLAGLLRVYQLSLTPGGLYWDEAVIGYDAFSLAKTGRDHTGNVPITFIKSFGDFKNPLYVYLTSTVIKLTGQLNKVSVRLTSVIAGIMTCWGVMILTKIWTKRKRVSLLAGLLIAISPWAVMMSRAGFEANLFLSLSLWAIIFFSWFIKNGKIHNLLLSSSLFGLTLYSYHSAKITTPLIVLSFFVIFSKKLLKLKFKLVGPLLVLFLWGIPFLNSETIKTTFFRVGGVTQVNQEVINKNADELLRDDYVAVNRFFHDSRYIRIKSYLSNYAKNLSFNYLFFEGDSNRRHSLDGFGQLYLVEMLSILAGGYYLLKLKKKSGLRKLLAVLLLISPVPSAISVQAPHALRSILLLIPLSMLSALGFNYLIGQKRIKILTLLLGVFILFQSFEFFHHYFNHYNYSNSTDWQYGYKDTIDYLKDLNIEGKKVVFTNEYSQALWYLAFYWPFDPSEFQQDAKIDYGESGRFWEATGSFKNFEVQKEIDWRDYAESNAVIVESPGKIPDELPKKTFYYPDGQVVFEVSDTSEWYESK